MTLDRVGRIVWHDLFTDEAEAAQAFYEKVAGWSYMVEHATDFAWGGGARDFVLALAGDEAGAGFVAREAVQPRGWVPYVEVEDVDASAHVASKLRGKVEKEPFEVPGVGRNCLLRDPNGALLGICLSRHSFPPPTKQFGAEIYLSQGDAFPEGFYRELFGWSTQPQEQVPDRARPITRAGGVVGRHMSVASLPGSRPAWVPAIRVAQLAKVMQRLEEFGGEVLDPAKGGRKGVGAALFADPDGALGYLVSD